jgi:hypothetical protein
MEKINFITGLTWPAAFTIVGTVVTIVVGLFGYIKSCMHQPVVLQPDQAVPSLGQAEPPSVQDIHVRISALKDTVAEIDSDLKVIEIRLSGVKTSLTDHESRDVADFKALSEKVEKIMGIIVEMLKDER